MIHYAQIGKRVVDHLVIHTGGIIVLTLREVTGKVIVNERRWRKGGNPLGRFFNYSAPQLGNPSLDNENDVAAVRAMLEEAGLPDASRGRSSSPARWRRCPASSPIDVLGIDELLEHVRAVANDRERPPLNAKERTAIVAALSQGKELEQPATRLERRKRAA